MSSCLSSLFAILLLALSFISTSCCFPVDPSSLESEEEPLLSGREDNGTTGDFERSCRTSTLCPEGIANIVVGGFLFGFLTCFACVMWQWEVQSDRKARIRIALARNREIDRQLEAAAKHHEQQITHSLHQMVPPVTHSNEESMTAGIARTKGEEGQREDDKKALLFEETSLSSTNQQLK